MGTVQLLVKVGTSLLCACCKRFSCFSESRRKAFCRYRNKTSCSPASATQPTVWITSYSTSEYSSSICQTTTSRLNTLTFTLLNSRVERGNRNNYIKWSIVLYTTMTYSDTVHSLVVFAFVLLNWLRKTKWAYSYLLFLSQTVRTLITFNKDTIRTNLHS